MWNFSSIVQLAVSLLSAANERDYRVEHGRRNSISPSNHVFELFCLLCKHHSNKKSTFQEENSAK